MLIELNLIDPTDQEQACETCLFDDITAEEIEATEAATKDQLTNPTADQADFAAVRALRMIEATVSDGLAPTPIHLSAASRLMV